jgi:tetratricopeptide (TPR) repeat protein
MKPNEASNRGMPAVTVLMLVCALSGLAIAYDKAQLGEAERYYQEGAASYEVADYKRAADSFKKSYDLAPYAETAYYLSVAYSKLQVFREAEDFARQALAADPPLQSEFVADAKKIIDWAQQVHEADEKLNRLPPDMRAKLDIGIPPPPEVRVPKSPKAE